MRVRIASSPGRSLDSSSLLSYADADLYLPGGRGRSLTPTSPAEVPPPANTPVFRRAPRTLSETELVAGVPETTFSPDNRQQVANAAVLPYSAICSLRILDNHQRSFLGTGFLAGPRLVVTAGHNVYFPGDGFMKSVEVRPGYSEQQQTVRFRAATATRFVTVEAWGKDRDPQFDFGAIFLPMPLGAEAGWLAVSLFTDGSLESQTAVVSGYPLVRPDGVAGLPGQTQWQDVSRLTAEFNRIRHLADTTEGQSGSPIFLHLAEHADPFHVVGIHNWGYASFNAGTRINDAVFSQIMQWRIQSEQS